MCESKCLHIRWHQIPGVGIKHNCVLPDGKNFNFSNILNKVKINVKREPLIVIFTSKLNAFYTMYSDISFPSPNSSQIFSHFATTQIYTFFLLLEYKQASDQNNKNNKIN